jgi:hypothetical protein
VQNKRRSKGVCQSKHQARRPEGKPEYTGRGNFDRMKINGSVRRCGRQNYNDEGLDESNRNLGRGFQNILTG